MKKYQITTLILITMALLQGCSTMQSVAFQNTASVTAKKKQIDEHTWTLVIEAAEVVSRENLEEIFDIRAKKIAKDREYKTEFEISSRKYTNYGGTITTYHTGLVATGTVTILKKSEK